MKSLIFFKTMSVILKRPYQQEQKAGHSGSKGKFHGFHGNKFERKKSFSPKNNQYRRKKKNSKKRLSNDSPEDERCKKCDVPEFTVKEEDFPPLA